MDLEGARSDHSTMPKTISSRNTTFGPTWEAPDGSKIVGAVTATAPAPRPGAILWYLASVSESSGIGVLNGIRFVQQINTVGGLLSGPCPTPGQERRVDYTADYLFWK